MEDEGPGFGRRRGHRAGSQRLGLDRARARHRPPHGRALRGLVGAGPLRHWRRPPRGHLRRPAGLSRQPDRHSRGLGPSRFPTHVGASDDAPLDDRRPDAEQPPRRRWLSGEVLTRERLRRRGANRLGPTRSAVRSVMTSVVRSVASAVARATAMAGSVVVAGAAGPDRGHRRRRGPGRRRRGHRRRRGWDRRPRDRHRRRGSDHRPRGRHRHRGPGRRPRDRRPTSWSGPSTPWSSIVVVGGRGRGGRIVGDDRVVVLSAGARRSPWRDRRRSGRPRGPGGSGRPGRGGWPPTPVPTKMATVAATTTAGKSRIRGIGSSWGGRVMSSPCATRGCGHPQRRSSEG